ncbi:MAG: peptide deformylase [Candidatus Omnitrophica bacterium]|nr:peptide deformylase [Candidatus Omnitrophota bacterium]
MPTKLKLRLYGDPVLRKVAKTVKSVGLAERLLMKELIAAMYDFDGAGLAATQVGIEEQIFVGDSGEGPFVVINPQILRYSFKRTILEEGCLSFPEIRIRIERAETISVRFQNEFGQVIEREYSGLPAKVFQHEVDHLNGRLIIDYATKTDLEKYKGQLAKLEVLSLKPSHRSKAHV